MTIDTAIDAAVEHMAKASNPNLDKMIATARRRAADARMTYANELSAFIALSNRRRIAVRAMREARESVHRRERILGRLLSAQVDRESKEPHDNQPSNDDEAQ